MKLWKAATLVCAIAFGLQAHADVATDMGSPSDESILLFTGDETPLDAVEAQALAESEENADAHPIGIRRAHVRCASTFFFTVSCAAPRRVISARLVRSFGFARCIPGRTFGATRNSVWVRNGCSGDFIVRYRPRN